MLDVVPGIGQDLLQAQRELALLDIVGQDLRLDDVPFLEQFLGVSDFLDPGQLGDMSQALDARLDLDEGPEIGQFGDPAFDHVSGHVFLLEMGPGVLGVVLQAKVDLLLHRIQADHLDLQLVAKGNQLLRGVDVPPAHVVDVQQPVETAQVHEGPEGGEGLDLAFHLVADLDLGEELFALALVL